MDSVRESQMSPRPTRIILGLGLVAAGCILFGLSYRHDPANRAALPALLLIIIGFSIFGQGLRRHPKSLATQAKEALQTAAVGSDPMSGMRVIVTPAGVRNVPTAISSERAVLAVFLGWLIPGLGHWVIGRRAKAVLLFTVITATFAAGVWFAEGRNMHWERNKIFYLAYVFNAGETVLAWLFAGALELDRKIPLLDLGFLYTAVASLLNVVAVTDVMDCTTRSAEEPA